MYICNMWRHIVVKILDIMAVNAASIQYALDKLSSSSAVLEARAG